MTTVPVCANTQLPQQPPPQAPSKSPVTEQTRAYYDSILKQAGVLAPSAESDARLYSLFTEAYAGLLHADLKAPGKAGGLDQLLAEKLGWKRWLWQKEGQATGAGAIRESLLERSSRASDLIKTYVQFEALPTIRELENTAKELLEPLVGATKARELLYDNVVVGQLTRLKNVSDSEVVANVVYQRFLKHQEELKALDPSGNLAEALNAVSGKLLQTTDDLAQLARSAGIKIETQANGGYFPNILTPEFENYVRSADPSWLSGFRLTKEKFQKARLSNLPVVTSLDEATALLQTKLTGVPLSDKAWVEYSAKELDILEQSTKQVQAKAEAVRAEWNTKAADKGTLLEAAFRKKQTEALATQEKLLLEKDKSTLSALREQLKNEPYSGNERQAILSQTAKDLKAAREQKLLKIESRWQERLNERLKTHYSSAAAQTEEEVAKVFASQTKEVQNALDFQKAKLTLADLTTTPNELARFLHDSFEPDELQKLFDNGILQSIPAATDELLEFYKSVDTGVRGLSDAILLNPVEAIKSYGNELAKAANEQALFKTAFNEGTTAGWVLDAPPVGSESQFLRVGQSPILQRYLQESGLPQSAGDLYIHKQVASALDALMQLNTRPGHLASASSALNMYLRPFRRMLLLGNGVGYVTRVFTQNLLAHYSATGSLAQLPFAMADSLRLINKGFDGLLGSKAVFNVGGKGYSTKELFQAMLGARGGHAVASMQEPADLLEGSLKLFSKDSVDRARHFNELYTRRFGEPLTGGLKNKVDQAGALFNASYRTLAFANQFLDLTFRWSVVRELASTKEFRNKSFEELMKRTDEYFSINADAGELGNWVGSFISPFAQFAINAPGSALRHALRHPWRTGNIMTLYAGAQGSSQLSESELPDWMKDNESYYFTMAKDPTTGKHFVVMPQSVDYLLDSYSWFAKLGRDLAGIDSSVGEAVESKSNPFYRVQKNASELLKKTYWFDIVAGISNVDPNNLKKYELGADSDTILGVPTSKGVRALITAFAPFVQTLDRSLPASVVGQAPTTKLVAGGNLRVVDNPGVPSLFGAVPSSGGASRDKELPPQAKAFQTLTGISVQDLDPQRNIIGTYKDFDTKLREIRTNRRAIYSRLAQSGRAPVPSEVQRYQQLKDLELVLMRNKFAIDQHAVETGQTPPYVYERMQGKLDELLTKPLQNDTMRELLQEYNKP